MLSGGVRIAAIASLVIVQVLGACSLARGQTVRLEARVAFVQGGNIWVLDGSSGRMTHLTNDGHDSSPRWSSDGRTLTFERQIGSRVSLLQWQASRGIKRLPDGLWSPDGTARAVTRTGPGPAMTVWVSRGGKEFRLTPRQPGFRWVPLGWSPDSSRLALGRFAVPPSTKPGQEVPASPATLWVTASGTTLLVHLPLPAISRGLSGWPDSVLWSPDSRFLALGVGPDFPCISCREDGRATFVIPVSGGKVIHLGTVLGPNEMISWAPGGSYVVVSSPAGRETYSHKHLFRVNATTGSRRTLAQDKRWADIEPSVSPDGKHIALVRGRAQESSVRSTPVRLIASRQVYVMDANGTRVRRLTAAPGWTDEAPAWTRDGLWVLFVRWHRQLKGKPAEADLWAVRSDGTKAQRLARLDLPGSFLNGFGYYGAFNWQALFDIAR